MLLTETTITTFTGDYGVRAYVQVPGENRPDWHPVLNFGSRPGDAIDTSHEKVFCPQHI